jgi:hypothetical protein
MLLLVTSCDPASFLDARVRDEKGQPIAGATVTLLCPQGGPRTIRSVSDAEGHARGFTIGCVDERCSIEVSSPGATPSRRKALDSCTEHKWFCGCTKVEPELVLSPLFR